MMSHDFKVISNFLLNKTHLITGSSNSENLGEKTAKKKAVFGRQKKG